MTRVALDTNVLAYLAGVSRSAADEAKIDQVRDVIARLSVAASLIAPAQTLGELFVVLRRSGASAEDARSILLEFGQAFGTSAAESRTVMAAADLVVDHKLQFWDSLIVTAAADAGCSLLLSEDMQNGFVTRGLTIVDPLRSELHPRLASLLETQA
ncbi:PIN domain-containing protein [Telmatospirillum sp.]|uniref:PIN domain-containing protein n=1 Tax=Telmatospirillum sp. TaxID=2079197 RepID=UPI002842C86F|nr:PIN domain-containing protein [Telmatospirillum sp.]MDR3438101.1 PIN domain-containing protein [Telmatospirillum sp.]